MISPIYDKLSHTHPEVGFGKIDVDDNSDAANEFSVCIIFLVDVILFLLHCIFESNQYMDPRISFIPTNLDSSCSYIYIPQGRKNNASFFGC
jgi:hypothetical protein